MLGCATRIAKAQQVEEPLNFMTHHKCASTWLARFLTDFCSTNSIRLFGTHYSNKVAEPDGEIAVFANASYDFLCDKICGGFHIIRNPLDIIVSSYYSHMTTHPLDGWPELDAQRKLLCSVSQSDGMFLTLAFLERDDFYRGAVGPLHAIRHWNFEDSRIQTLRMEDVVQNPQRVLGSVLRSQFAGSVLPSGGRHTFEAVAGRQIGKIDNMSHYRSGRPEQWREVLPKAIASYVKAHFANVLEQFYPHAL